MNRTHPKLGTLTCLCFLLVPMDLWGQATVSYEIPLESGTVTLEHGSIETGGHRYLLVQFDENLTRTAIESLEDSGITPLSFLYQKAWLCAVEADALTPELIQISGIAAATPWLPEYKISPELRTGKAPTWAITEEGGIKLLVQFFSDADRTAIDQVVRWYTTVYKAFSEPDVWAIQLEPERIEELIGEPIVKLVEAGPLPLLPVNDNARILLNVDSVQDVDLTKVPPLYNGLSGQEVNVAVSETVYTNHHDFWEYDASGNPTTNRFLNHDPSSHGTDHGTWVAGIIGGNGWQSHRLSDLGYDNGGTPYQWRGVAPEVTLISGPGYGSYAVHASNHSYVLGYGSYGMSSQTIDKQVRGGEGSERQKPHVWAACNQGRTAQYDNEEGYYSIYAPAKNAIVVGGTFDNGTFDPVGSQGPTFDGRIKPDLVAGMDGIVSTWRSRSTGTDWWREADYVLPGWGGTSGSAPAVTGTVALMLQQFSETHGIDITTDPPVPSTIKAVLVHTARDLGPADEAPGVSPNPDTGAPEDLYEGPDFSSGYGLANALAAVELIEQAALEALIHESALEEFGDTYDFAVPAGTTRLKVSLAWDDVEGPVGIDERFPRLVNDLDLLVTRPYAAAFHYPWTLNPLPVADCGGAGPGCGDLDPITTGDVVPAHKAPDHLNNVEVVEVDNPEPGPWRVFVLAHNMQDVSDGPQGYSLVADIGLTRRYETSVPRCFVGYPSPGHMEISVQELPQQTGLWSIEVLEADNVSVAWDPFVVGTNEQVIVTATQVDDHQQAGVRLEVFDVAGNSTQCEAEVPPMVCEPMVEVGFPPPHDQSSFVEGCYAQLNGVVITEEGCPEIERVHWQWGDGVEQDSWFPALHQYQGNGTYSVTTTAYDQGGNTGFDAGQVIVDACDDPSDRLLIVSSAGSGSGSVGSWPGGIQCGEDCREVFPDGTAVSLTCVPEMGSEFSGFGGDSDCADGRLTMDSTKSCEAWFEPCSLPSRVSLLPQSVDDIQQFEACNILEALLGFTIEATGDATFRAGNSIVLGSKFSVLSGAKFEARIGPQ